MFDERLKTSLWVSAEIRRCEGLFLPVMVLHKGDGDRGLVLIKHYVAGQGVILYVQRRDMAGKFIWARPLGDDFIAENKADEYILRQRKFDEDLWVIEVEDPRSVYQPL